MYWNRYNIERHCKRPDFLTPGYGTCDGEDSVNYGLWIETLTVGDFDDGNCERPYTYDINIHQSYTSHSYHTISKRIKITTLYEWMYNFVYNAVTRTVLMMHDKLTMKRVNVSIITRINKFTNVYMYIWWSLGMFLLPVETWLVIWSWWSLSHMNDTNVIHCTAIRMVRWIMYMHNNTLYINDVNVMIMTTVIRET